MKIFAKKKYIWTGVAILVLTAMTAALAGALAQQVGALPENPINGVNSKRSQQLVTGQGFILDKEQERDYKKQKKLNEKERKKDSKSQSVGDDDVKQTPGGEGEIKTPGNSGDKSDGDDSGGAAQKPEDPKPEPPDPEAPRIKKTNLKEKEEIPGDYKEFWLLAVDRKDRYISGANIIFTVNGARERYLNDTGKKVSYGADLVKGANTITVKLTDSYGKSRTYTYTVYGDPDQEGEIEGTISLTLEAATIGKGVLIRENAVKVQAGKPFPFTLEKVLKEKGYTMNYTGSLKNGFYLARINRAGITAGFQIPEALQQKLNEMGYTKKPHEDDTLGQMDFTTESGWTYQVNGTFYDRGMSMYIPKNGDDVRIRFTLWMGYDLNGNWGDW